MPPRGFTPRGVPSPGRRPRTSQSLRPSLRGLSAQWAVNPEDEAIPEEDEDEDQIELLEYEWPDLPPIPAMKDAVSRRRVAKGISYLLPVDKGRNSINNRFRTDLRAMFQEPYASDDLQYDDNRVQLSAKIHFRSNTADTKWTREHLSSIPIYLNHECENARKLYVHSAPAGGSSSRRMGIDPNKMQKRSNLFLPVKASTAKVSPDILKLREEANEIIKAGLACQDGSDDGDGVRPMGSGAKVIPGLMATQESLGQSQDSRTRGHLERNKSNNNMMATYGGTNLGDSLGSQSLKTKLQCVVQRKQDKYENYEQLAGCEPPKPVIPPELTSSHMSRDDNQRIWDWMHYGESMSDFEYFLSVCG